MEKWGLLWSFCTELDAVRMDVCQVEKNNFCVRLPAAGRIVRILDFMGGSEP